MAGRFTRLLLLIAVTAVSVGVIIASIHAFGFRGPITVFLVCWLVVACMATVALSVDLPLPSWYCEIKTYENGGRLYEHLGIRFFNKLVRRGPLSIFSRTLRLPKGNTGAALRELEQKLRGAEAIHVYSLLAICPLLCYCVFLKWSDAAGWLLLFNWIVNGYPIMLQRYNRIRVQKQLTRSCSNRDHRCS